MLIHSVMDLGSLLRARRQELGETQLKFAARIGKPQSWLSDFERGAIGNVYFATVIEVWAAAGMSISCDLPDRAATPRPDVDLGDIATEFDSDEEPGRGFGL